MSQGPLVGTGQGQGLSVTLKASSRLASRVLVAAFAQLAGIPHYLQGLVVSHSDILGADGNSYFRQPFPL